MGAGELLKDIWHREAVNISIRNGIQLRRWGMRVTVYNDATPANNGDWVLEYNRASTNRKDNANWLKVADINTTWGGGGSSVNFINGIGELSPGNVGLGGSALTQATTLTFDPGASMQWNGFNGNYFAMTMSDADSFNDTLFSPIETSFSLADLLGNSLHFGADLASNRWRSTRIEYQGEYFSSYTDDTLPSWGNVKSHFGGQSVGPTVISPTGAQDGYVLAWNNGTLEYDLVPPGASTFQNGVGESSPGVVELGINPLTTDAIIDTTAASLSIGDQTPGGELVFFAGPAQLQIASNYFAFNFTGTDTNLSATFQDGRTTQVGIQYTGTINRTNWTNTTLVDKFFAINQIGGKNVNANITAPAVGQNGFFISWNNATQQYVLTAGSGSLTFSNGLTLTGSAVTLGGALTQNTDITGASGTFNMTFGLASPLNQFQAYTDAGVLLQDVNGANNSSLVLNSGQANVFATNFTQFQHSQATVVATPATIILKKSTTNNNIGPILRLETQSTTAGAVGFGGSIQYFLQNGFGNLPIASDDQVYWQDATDTLEYANYKKRLKIAGVMTDVMQILTSSTAPNIFITLFGRVIAPNLPISSAGLPAGTFWNNSGVVNVV
jgi:hypothetical protein